MRYVQVILADPPGRFNIHREKSPQKEAFILLCENCLGFLTAFVYFDQRTGAPHAVRWSKSIF